MVPSLNMARAHIRALERDESHVIVRGNPNLETRHRVRAFWLRHGR